MSSQTYIAVTSFGPDSPRTLCLSYVGKGDGAKIQRRRLIFHKLKKKMAKKSKIESQKKRSFLVKKYSNKRIFFKSKLINSAQPQEALLWQSKLQDLPRNCFPVRLRRRCTITGRPRGCFSDFGLSRHVLRQLAHEGVLPGVTKSSW